MLAGRVLQKEFGNAGEVVTDGREDKASGRAPWDRQAAPGHVRDDELGRAPVRAAVGLSPTASAGRLLR